MQSKQKLGRGLSALIGEIDSFDTLKNPVVSPEKIPSSDTAYGHFISLSIKQIKPGPWQPRQNFNDDEIEKLSLSIKENGLLQPILVMESQDKETYEIIAGERRWRAALRAKLDVIPCLIKRVTEEQAQFIALIENIQREELSAIEEAEGYQKILDQYQYTQEKISEVVGKSRSHIANTLRLLNLPKSIRNILQNHEISAGHARCLIGMDEHQALTLIDEIIQKKLNVRQLEKLVQRMGGDPSLVSEKKIQSSVQPDGSDLQKICADLERVLQTKISLKEKKGAGQLILDFKTLEQLDKILEKLSL